MILDHTLRDHTRAAFEGRVCVVTGGAGGIGSEIAKRFASQGASVAVLDRPGTACDTVVVGIREMGGVAVAVACDISDESSIREAAVVCQREIGLCDILVNNAAALQPVGLLDIDIRDWNRVMAVNLTGALLCAREFASQMGKKGAGAIVHVGSICGSQARPFSGPYSVSKAGLTMLSQLLALELAAFGIRSNVVSPGLVRTPLSEDMYNDPEVLKRRTELVPSGRIGTPGDIADVVLFLAGGHASYINGQEILVDGGLSRKLMSLVPRADAPAR